MDLQSSGSLADLLNALYQANHTGIAAGQLGAAYVIPTLIVPLLFITYGLSFRILPKRGNKPVGNKVPLAA
ncbi:MAG TPA: hypothetical protein VFW94_18620 [Candidatus Acidoferrales bacterium]|nr:hypothetical protein [Candidatus Acidoferrales bacterium]